jgi:hypothetical protein
VYVFCVREREITYSHPKHSELYWIHCTCSVLLTFFKRLNFSWSQITLNWGPSTIYQFYPCKVKVTNLRQINGDIDIISFLLELLARGSQLPTVIYWQGQLSLHYWSQLSPQLHREEDLFSWKASFAGHIISYSSTVCLPPTRNLLQFHPHGFLTRVCEQKQEPTSRPFSERGESSLRLSMATNSH